MQNILALALAGVIYYFYLAVGLVAVSLANKFTFYIFGWNPLRWTLGL